MNKAGIEQIVTRKAVLREKLFAGGFLFTNTNVEADDYPFYGLWHHEHIGAYTLLVSPSQHSFVVSTSVITAFLIGHAYNPCTMVPDENQILSDLVKDYSQPSLEGHQNTFWHHVNELTGVFTLILLDGETVYVIGDTSGMQTTFYTVQGQSIAISTHTNLIGDLFNLQWDPYVKRLTSYRYFKLLGNALPGDLTQFSEVKRLVPNHYVKYQCGEVSVTRFYWPHRLRKTNQEIVQESASLLHANMKLISQKWQKPAISLTGGCDSKTTLSCANGLYDRFGYFSYISSEAEKVDAEAAAEICKSLGLKHQTYLIPGTIDGAEDVAEILNWNTGNIRYSHPEDVRKRIFFADSKDFDVEIKSWASEIGRAYYTKRFNGRTNFGSEPTPRKCTTLYKFFLNDRKLVKQTDAVFEAYLSSFFQQAENNPIEWQEQFFWEFRVPSWNGLVVTGEHRYSFDITIPYNNRRILELLLSAPANDRIADSIYRDIRSLMNPNVEKTGIAVTNLKHTDKRAKMENLYYVIHSKAPF